MPLTFLADMPVAQATVSALRAQGCDVVHARELGLERAPDEEVLREARARGRMLITMDLDFGELSLRSQPGSPGVILLRLAFASPARVTASMIALLRTVLEEELVGHLIIVEEGRVRTRRLGRARGGETHD